MGVQGGVERYVEISPTNRHGLPPRLVHVEDIKELTGFRSVYEYPVETCKWIRNNWSERTQSYGSVNGLAAAELEVYSDTLFIDIDDDEESARRYIECLKKWDVTHGIWDSGNRSVHIHIPTIPKLGPHVPLSQKVFMEEWGESIGARVDTSIYHAAGLYRLPGTIHEKTGKPKVCIGGHWGSTLDYEIVSPTKAKFAGSPELLSVVWRLLLTPVDAGGRHLHVFKIASNAAKLGWDIPKIKEHALAWNTWQPEEYRLTEEAIESKIYRSVQ